MMRRRLIAAAMIVMAACTSHHPATTGATTAPQASSSSNGSDLMLNVVVAVRRAGSFHLRATSTQNGTTAVFVQEVGSRQGIQNITIGKQHATIVVINAVAYLRANKLALLQFMGFPAAIADRLHDRWISFTPTDAPYTDIAASVTLDSALNEIAIDGPVTKTAETTVLGRRVVGLTGNGFMNGKETLYVPATGTPFPVQEILSISGGSEAIVFSHWGETVRVAKPTSVIAFSSVVRSSGEGQTA